MDQEFLPFEEDTINDLIHNIVVANQMRAAKQMHAPDVVFPVAETYINTLPDDDIGQAVSAQSELCASPCSTVSERESLNERISNVADVQDHTVRSTVEDDANDAAIGEPTVSVAHV